MGEDGAPHVIVKAAVAPVDGTALVSVSAAAEFFATVQAGAVLGKLQVVQVPLNTRMVSITQGTVASWVKAGSPKPISRLSLAGEVLEPRKVSAILVTTKELIERSDPKTEARFNADLQRACVELLDASFVDPSNAGVADESPASITNGVVAMGSTGNPGEDVAALVAAFNGDLASAFFITDPTTATEIALARDAGGSFAFPDCGARGGSIVGIPLLTSKSSPRDSSGGNLVLLDASAVGVGVEGVRVARSEQATLQMSDTPDDPVSAATELVSLWQSNLVAFLVEVFANWKLAKPDAVAVVTGATYATEP